MAPASNRQGSFVYRAYGWQADTHPDDFGQVYAKSLTDIIRTTHEIRESSNKLNSANEKSLKWETLNKLFFY